MTSILQNEKWRILSNYLRLFAGLVIGLTVTRLLIGISETIYGIYITITVGFGISVIITELLRMGLVPVLGVEVQDGRVVNRGKFREVLSAALAISAGFALAGALIMLLLGLWFLPQADDPEIAYAAKVFLGLRIATMLVVVGLTPFTSVLLVTGRQPRYNFFLFLERLSELVAVVLSLWVFTGLPSGEADKLVQIGTGTSVFVILTYTVCAWGVLRLGRDFRPKWGWPEYNTLRQIMGRIGWSSLQTLSMNLYVRFDILLVAAVFGPAGALAFGVATRLMGFIRQATVGLVNGLDSIFANLAGIEKRRGQHSGDKPAIHARLVEMSTSLQAALVFQGIVFILLLRNDLVTLWIGDVLDPAQAAGKVAQISDLSALMVLGIGLRSLNLGWMSAMTGKGLAHRFTPWLVPAAIANPVILVGWYLMAPESFSVISVGWVFVGMQVITHVILLPPIAARVLQIPLHRLLRPMAIPLVIALVSGGAGLAITRAFETNSILMRDGSVAVVVLLGLASGLIYTWRRIHVSEQT